MRKHHGDYFSISVAGYPEGRSAEYKPFQCDTVPFGMLDRLCPDVSLLSRGLSLEPRQGPLFVQIRPCQWASSTEFHSLPSPFTR